MGSCLILCINQKQEAARTMHIARCDPQMSRDALLARRFKYLRNLLGDRECIFDRNQSLRDAAGKRGSHDQLRDEHPLSLFEVSTWPRA